MTPTIFRESKLFKIIALATFLTFPWTGKAQQNCTNQPKTYQEILRCSEQMSPEIQRAELELAHARSQVGAASQWRNPELSVDSVQGGSGADQKSETGINLGIPIELGGKISARTSIAESAAARAEAALYQVKANVRAATLLKLHRLRQLTHEQEVIDESIGTFTKLVTQFSQRFKLSPEQEISVAVFKMSKSEYDLKKTEVLSELNSLDSYFQTTIGLGIRSLTTMLPQSPKAWPRIDGSQNSKDSPKMLAAKADMRAAQANLNLAESEAWPTLTVGPSAKLQNESGRSNQLYGFNLSLPLPVFNANGKGKAAAASGLRYAEKNQNLALTEQSKIRDEMLRTYQQSVAALNATLSHEDIEKKHSNIERLFFRGVVPSSLVIEAHRTYVELEKSRNSRELKALEALMTIYTIDGNILEAQL